MNLNVQTRGALAPNAFAAEATNAAPGAGGAAFAGLLGAQRAGSGQAYGGSAFEVPAAKREPQPAATRPARAEPPRPSQPPAAQRRATPAQPDAARPSPAASPNNGAAAKSTATAPAATRQHPDVDAGDVEVSEADVAGPNAGTETPIEAGIAAAPDSTSTSIAASPDLPVPATPADPQHLLDWLARLALGPAAEAGVGDAAADAAPTGAPGLPGADGSGPGAFPPATAKRAERRSPHVVEALQAPDSPALAAAASPARAELLSSEQPAVTPAQALPPGAAPLAAAHPSPSAAPAALALATPVNSPDFSQALATQLTTLVRKGVHEAQLQLNPAEMGPIAIQIVLDGALAQIDFSAAHAGTRQVIEAGLPTLAAALNSAGLTLSGGGVFEQRQAPARDGQPGDGPGGRRSGAGAAPVAGEEGPRARPVAALGLLDLDAELQRLAARGAAVNSAASKAAAPA